jgi:hypothetical protein
MDSVNALGVEKNPFCKRGLAGIDVGADSNISQSGQITVHCLFLRFPFRPVLRRVRPSLPRQSSFGVKSRTTAGLPAGTFDVYACFPEKKTGTQTRARQELVFLTKPGEKEKDYFAVCIR